ncbi:MAG TPA: DUF2202 domain-containing protein [Thiobacillus sp.]
MRTRTISMLFMATLLILGSMRYSDAYSATVQLSADETADLLFMREEEKLARDTYLTLYEKWNYSVFTNIAESEQSHMDAMLKLLKKYKLPDPVGSNGIGVFSDPTLQSLYNTLIAKGQVSGLEALKVGGLIEEKDMIDIKAAIERSQQDAIDAVYESLICGSRNHLRSFATNIQALTSQPYVAQLLDPAEVAQILASPMERCSKKGHPDKDD